jgi:DASS family divalent anion:Na+ symporter
MAANPIVVAKANKLFPDLNFGFMTWLQGSVVPAIVCALCIPLLIRWSLGLNFDKPSRGKHARQAHNVIQHAQMEINKMGSVSAKEWVRLHYASCCCRCTKSIKSTLYILTKLCFL